MAVQGQVIKRWGAPLLLLASLGCQRGPHVRFASASHLLDRLHESSACSRGVVGDASIEVRGPLVGYAGQLLFRVEAPEKLRLDLYSDFGVSLATLAGNAKEITFLDLANRHVYRGPSSAQSVAQLAQVPVPPFALVELLRGRAPVLVHGAGDISLKLHRPMFSPPYYSIKVKGEGESEEKIWVEIDQRDRSAPLSEQRVRLQRVQVKQAGRTQYDVQLSDFQVAHRASLEASVEEKEMGVGNLVPTGPECEAEVPRQLSFKVRGTGHRLELTIHEVAHNPPAWEDAFQLAIPGGMTSSNLGCAGCSQQSSKAAD